MALEVITCPYHDGRRDTGMGLGATALAGDDRVRLGLEAAGPVSVGFVPPVDESLSEIARIIELDRRLAHRVRAARRRRAFPLVFAGNCSSCLGTVAGVGTERLGVVWFDAHADFDTAEDNRSGFFDVMGLSILTGTGWTALRETIPGFAPVRERDVVLAAVRDLEPYQQLRLDKAEIRTVPRRVDRARLRTQLEALSCDVERVYLHVDLDSLDAGVGHANRYAAPGGPSTEALIAAIGAVFERFRVEAAALTAYDPRFDADGAIAAAARQISAAIASGAGDQGRRRSVPGPQGPLSRGQT